MNSERLQRLQEEGPSSSAYKKSPSKGLNKKFQEGSRERLERMNPSDPSAQPSLETPTTQQGGQQRKRKLGAPQQEPPEESVEEMEAKEGEFRLHQNKLRAGIRIKDGRGLPIDILIANYYFALDLLFGLDLEESALEMDPSDPWTLFSQLDPMQLSQIEVDLKAMAEIDSDPEGRDYWASLRALAGQEILAQKRLKAGLGKYEGVQASTAEDLDTLFGSKSYDELVTLDQQVTDKLQAGGPIDTEYWDAAQQCLRSWKAKTRVSQIYSRLQAQRKEHISSRKLKRKVDPIYIRFGLSVHALKEKQELSKERDAEALVDPVKYETYDPSMSPVLKAQLGPEDKGLDIMELETFMKNLDFAREKVQEAVADKKKERASKPHGSDSTANKKKKIDAEVVASPPPPVVESHKKSKAQEAEAAFLREAASGMGEGEEVFANEEQLLDASSALVYHFLFIKMSLNSHTTPFIRPTQILKKSIDRGNLDTLIVFLLGSSGIDIIVHAFYLPQVTLKWRLLIS